MIAGLDIGTTSVKFSIYDPEGCCLAEKAADHHGVVGGVADYEAIWNAAVEVIRACGAAGKQVRSLAISTFGESMALRAVDGSLLPQEPRTFADRLALLEELTRRFGEEELFRRTGLIPGEHFPLIRLLELARRTPPQPPQPSVQLLESFFLQRLTGENAVSSSSASRTMLFRAEAGCWDEDLMAFAGLEENQLPRVVPTGTPIGRLRQEMAGLLGLSPDTLLSAGGHDQLCCAIGAGPWTPDTLVNCSGTMESLGRPLPRETPASTLLAARMQRCPTPWPDWQFTFYAPVRGCSTLDLFAHRFAAREVRQAEQAGLHPQQYLQRLCKEDPAGPLVIPYFGGRGYPDRNPRCRGMVLGLTPDTGPGEVYQAFLEGIAFELRRCLERWQEAGLSAAKLLAVGGGARGDYWLARKADILGLPVERPPVRQAGTLGAAILGGMGSGLLKDQREAERLFGKGSCFYLDQRRKELYQEKYQRYCEVVNNYDWERTRW